MGASLNWSARTRHQEEALPRRGSACVIESDDVDRDGVASLLRHMGFTTHDTPSGAVGALIAEQIHLSVIVINVMMKDVQALKVIRQMRARAPSAVIIALSSDTRALALAHAAGADAVLASPPCGEALCATITDALNPSHHRAPGAAAPWFFEEPIGPALVLS
jgi:DNA-binding response OmpR family regulator